MRIHAQTDRHTAQNIQTDTQHSTHSNRSTHAQAHARANGSYKYEVKKLMLDMTRGLSSVTDSEPKY